jgi:hypothetical protein
VRVIDARHGERRHLDVAEQAGRSAHMATDQISFYDESLQKQIEGFFVSDGREIRVSSIYGLKSVPYADLGACIDYNAQVLTVKKLLSAMARDAAKDMKGH